MNIIRKTVGWAKYVCTADLGYTFLAPRFSYLWLIEIIIEIIGVVVVLLSIEG